MHKGSREYGKISTENHSNDYYHTPAVEIQSHFCCVFERLSRTSPRVKIIIIIMVVIDYCNSTIRHKRVLGRPRYVHQVSINVLGIRIFSIGPNANNKFTEDQTPSRLREVSSLSTSKTFTFSRL